MESNKSKEKIKLTVSGTATRQEIVKDLRLLIKVLLHSEVDELNAGWNDCSVRIDINFSPPNKEERI